MLLFTYGLTLVGLIKSIGFSLFRVHNRIRESSHEDHPTVYRPGQPLVF